MHASQFPGDTVEPAAPYEDALAHTCTECICPPSSGCRVGPRRAAPVRRPAYRPAYEHWGAYWKQRSMSRGEDSLEDVDDAAVQEDSDGVED
eukprot:gene12066-biopygen11990